MFKNIPFNRVEWVTSGFLIITALLTLTAVPWYFWTYGWDWFLFGVLLFYYIATGMSITLGYHRLFSHKAFKASWPVRLFVLLFGAAAFENSALWWSSEHRKHHKHVDTDDDPYRPQRFMPGEDLDIIQNLTESFNIASSKDQIMQKEVENLESYWTFKLEA